MSEPVDQSPLRATRPYSPSIAIVCFPTLLLEANCSVNEESETGDYSRPYNKSPEGLPTTRRGGQNSLSNFKKRLPEKQETEYRTSKT